MAAIVVERPDSGAPQTTMSPASTRVVWMIARGRPSCSKVGSTSEMTRMMIMKLDRCRRTLTRKRPMPRRLHEPSCSLTSSMRSADPLASSTRTASARVSFGERVGVSSGTSTPSMRAWTTSPARTWMSVAPRLTALSTRESNSCSNAPGSKAARPRGASGRARRG